MVVGRRDRNGTKMGDDESKAEHSQFTGTRLGGTHVQIVDDGARLHGRAHNSLVQGSNPCGPTTNKRVPHCGFTQLLPK
jgi:hypothetical protein